ncbi:hypothetical protein [Thermosulfurimonas sp. F29]|uniref:hypothetical protein n=1 Tax=Thermosulfurimonas sp. F29 TaxID=2867247 RepID=UPI001C83139A|nr:hypothetical protein [Thermosulfurimonas sp. F29]MBX6422095.1 hypothetical protein [Thermosulfurimonas sp. F29]
MSRKGALLLILIIISSCAVRIPSQRPEVPRAAFSCYRALVRYEFSAPGRRQRGRAVVLVRGHRLYAEGFSPFGGVLFSLWVNQGVLTMVSFLEGQGLRLRLAPESRLLDGLWPYLLLGCLPRNGPSLDPRGKANLGNGYRLSVTGSPGVIRLSFRGREFLRIRSLSRGRVLLYLKPFRMRIDLSLQRLEPICEIFPPPPRLPERILDLNRYLSAEGD